MEVSASLPRDEFELVAKVLDNFFQRTFLLDVETIADIALIRPVVAHFRESSRRSTGIIVMVVTVDEMKLRRYGGTD